MSLRWRIALGLAAIAAVICILAASASYVSTARRLNSEVDNALLADAGDVRGPGPSPEGGRGDGDCPPGVFQQTSAAEIVSADGDVHQCIPGGVRIPVENGDTSMGVGQHRFRTVTIGGEDYRVMTASFGDGRVLQLARSLKENQDVLSSLRVRLVGISVLGIGAAAALGWLFARRIVRPIERLRATAEHIAETQDLDAPITHAGSDEVASLGKSFSTMVGALARSRRQQQRLIVDASHELRTPLTALRTNAELLERHALLTEGQRAQVAQGIKTEVGELTMLVSELVELATDQGGGGEPIETTDLAQLAERVVERARLRTDRRVELTADGNHAVTVRPHMIDRAISNLVDNAVKYGDGEVEVTVAGRRLEVRDHGQGIDETDVAHVFDRFYRSDAARTQTGSGLGLAIVQQIITLHGGTVWAGNHAQGGALIGFELPSAQGAHT